ncbi:hypothetical protein K402DRAFT_350008 [Aulographum hederae CBS 113979]|uniref:Uncharacterized protein n=1 Tax=Aulographum hederae CBS 113979 TaxID=1176131 RepID=A0A6G1H9E8_9PEZI|nr:hypothetical protein K402DRAFT_350008 [Aulographum hederae CBS 113979]
MPRPSEIRTYAQVADDEDSRPLREEKEVSEEQDYRDTEIYNLARNLQRTNLYLRILLGLASFIILLILLGGAGAAYKTQRYENGRIGGGGEQGKVMAGKLIKSPVPELPLERTVFQKTPIFNERPNEKSDQAWNDLLPSTNRRLQDGRGFVYIPDSAKYDLPLGQETPWGMIYSTALFHQLHCLGQIRHYTWLLIDAVSQNDTAMQAELMDHLLGEDGGQHLHHCYDYLRQTIQCAGDMSIEWPRTEADGKTRIAVDGWGIPHECKSWSGIMDYMDKNHFNMSSNANIAPTEGLNTGLGSMEQLNDLEDLSEAFKNDAESFRQAQAEAAAAKAAVGGKSGVVSHVPPKSTWETGGMVE